MWLDHEVQLEQEKDSLIKTCLTLCMCLCVFPCFLRHTSGHTHTGANMTPQTENESEFSEVMA